MPRESGEFKERTISDRKVTSMSRKKIYKQTRKTEEKEITGHSQTDREERV